MEDLGFHAQAGELSARMNRLVRPLSVLAQDIAKLSPERRRQQVRVDKRGSTELEVIAERGARELADASAQEILRWAADEFGPGFAVAGSMQDNVLVHLYAATSRLWREQVLGVDADGLMGLIRTGAEDLLRGADIALYQAKRQGRNRVVSADALDLTVQPENLM